jgi:hypothetical protein
MVKNQPNQVIGAQMVDATTGAAYAGGVTVYITGDGGTQTLGSVNSGICQPEGNGLYNYFPTASETNYTLIQFTFIGAGSIPATIQVATVTAASQQAVTGTSGTLAFTVRSLIADALVEIGVLEPGEQASAAQADIGLRRVQAMIDTWAADRLTLSLQLRTAFTWPATTSSVQVGIGQTVNMDRPMWLNAVKFVIPGSSPAIEVAIGMMDEDAYSSLSIKGLPSALPTQSFYQTNLTDANATLFLWPQPQSLTIVLYSPQAVGVPASLNSIIQGPPGYADAFLYQLALRLCSPFGVKLDAVPLLPGMARAAFENMKKPNVDPGAMSVDPALVPGAGAGWNYLTGNTTYGNR